MTTVFFLLLIYYGADFVYKRLTKLVEGYGIKAQLDSLIAEVARECRISEDRLRQILDDRYGKGRMRSLVKATLRVFRPSKQRGNAAMRVGGRRIEPHIVAEVPGDAQMLDFDEPIPTRALSNVEIEIHAQDIDRDKQGWAGVIPALSSRRVRMELYPPIRPVDLYTKARVRGDVIAVFREDTKGEQVPAVYYLTRLTDQPAASLPSPMPPASPVGTPH